MIDAQLEILRPGMQTTIQDLGRPGLMHLGISHSGVMDELSMLMANRLVGMPGDNAVLEMTQVGADIRFSSDMVIAITGAKMNYRLNGLNIANYQAINVKKGDKLTFHGCQSGFRSYLAFSGRLQIPAVLNSYSTQLNAGLGGLHGGPLKNGDVIPLIIEPSRSLKKKKISPVHFSGHFRIRFTPAPESEHFDSKNFEVFQQHTYYVSQNLNRMGIRLSGKPVRPEQYPSYDSRGLLPGAIQVPPDGQPIIAGMDAQTSGGYLRIGQVIQADMPIIGQLKPGDEIEFLPIEIERARGLLKAQRTLLSNV